MLLTDSDPKHTFPPVLDLRQVTSQQCGMGAASTLHSRVDCASPVNSSNLCMNHNSFVNCSTIVVFL